MLSKNFEKIIYSILAKVQYYFSPPSKLGSLTLEAAAFEDVHLPPVAIETLEGRKLSTNQLHNIEQVPINNQQPFVMK